MHPLEQAWESVRRDFDAVCFQRARSAREATTTQLNQLLRRLRSYKKESEWLSILAESASMFAGQLAIFEVHGSELKLRIQRGMSLPEDLVMPVTPAFASAVETKDTVVALRSAYEMGEALSHPEGRARLIPIVNGERVVAVLLAVDHADVDPNALELITGFASVVLERGSNADLHSQLVAKKAQPRSVTSEKLPAWGELTETEQTLHLRAQRFSRVAVAEAQMARPEACAAGREAGNVYLFMQGEIDKAREAYRKQFMVIPSMIDYLHMELVRVIADNDEAALGVEYPGAMV